MEKIISIFLGIFIITKGTIWIRMGKTGVKTNYILGGIAIVAGILIGRADIFLDTHTYTPSII